jgi:hypothetical protein
MKKRTHIVRRITTAAVLHRGSKRPIVATLDPKAGTFTVRLHSCRKAKTYQIEDLFVFGPQLSIL